MENILCVKLVPCAEKIIGEYKEAFKREYQLLIKIYSEKNMGKML
jgi:hypothetical protein